MESRLSFTHMHRDLEPGWQWVRFKERTRSVGNLIIAWIFLSATLVSIADITPMKKAITTILQPNTSPLVSFRLLFRTGAAHDPTGKEGVAALTAAMLAKGGSQGLAYDQIVAAMYPMATSFEWQVDKEMTVFYGTTHRDNLDAYYRLIRSMLLEPGFRADDFSRLKADAINYLKVTLRDSNDEELGKEELYNIIYRAHPYGHQNQGRVSSLEHITIEDVQAFYHSHYLQRALFIGLAGGFPIDFPDKLAQDFTRLPSRKPATPKMAAPKTFKGTRVEIIQRETRSTAISLGFPLQVKRGDKDWPALALVASYFGQHRSSNSHLYQQLREARGLNYGDYAYIEYFPRGMFLMQPEPNLGRSQQIFQIWIRPVEPQNGLFALRTALYEYDKLVRDGLSAEAFETTREFLTKYVHILTQTQEARLGYALDSAFYGTTEFNIYLREQLARLTLAQVNQAIKRHLKTNLMQIVLVTKAAEDLRHAILDNQASPISYNSPKSETILAEDKIIMNFKLAVKPEDLKIVPVQQVFE